MKHHPEQEEDEIFLGNLTLAYFENQVGWETKRIGTVAYDAEGEIIKRFFPVFVKVSEAEESVKKIQIPIRKGHTSKLD